MQHTNDASKVVRCLMWWSICSTCSILGQRWSDLIWITCEHKWPVSQYMVGGAETYNLHITTGTARFFHWGSPFCRLLSPSRFSNSSWFRRTNCHCDNSWSRSLWLKGELLDWTSVGISATGGVDPRFLFCWGSISGEQTELSFDSIDDPSEWFLPATDVPAVPLDPGDEYW